MNPALKVEEPGGKASAVLAVLVHVLLAAFLIVGVRWQTSKPEAVVVELWDRAPVQEEPAPPPPKVEPAPEPKPEPKIEPKPQAKVEPKPAKPDIAVEREKKPPKKEPPKKEPPKKEPPKKVEEPPLKLDPTERIREELAREMEALKQPRERPPTPARPAAGPVLDAGYAAKLRGRIRSNIVLPQNIQGNPEAEFTIVQLPTGEVLSVTMRKSSGHKLLDEAIERAILKSSPLPRPDRPDQFQREIRITYRPLD
jgi:colicin import membrane protein